MPDIDLGAGNRLALRVLDPGIDENRLARRRRTHDRSAVRGRRRISAPERAEQVGGGLGGTVAAVVEEADEGREAQRTRHQHRLVVALIGFLANRYDVARGCLEFRLGQLYLAGKGM